MEKEVLWLSMVKHGTSKEHIKKTRRIFHLSGKNNKKARFIIMEKDIQ